MSGQLVWESRVLPLTRSKLITATKRCTGPGVRGSQNISASGDIYLAVRARASLVSG